MQEIKEYECSGWIYDLYINTFVSYCFNKVWPTWRLAVRAAYEETL